MSVFANLTRTVFVAAALFVAPACQTTMPPASEADAPVTIREDAFVQIGGIEQWITIRGDDRRNPVVLFLHGGPGNAESMFADAVYGDWERDFTLVQWDQRGAGRTFARNPDMDASVMTVERMVEDAEEVADYLTQYLDTPKVIVVGTSWGSILGAQLALRRPDLLHAYVGQAQVVNWQANVATSYARVLERAQAEGDQEAIDALTSIGPPPWHNVRVWPHFRRWQRTYQAQLATAASVPFEVSPDYASPEEEAQNEAADEFSFVQFWGMTLDGPLTHVDLPALGTDFSIPVFIVQGGQDIVATPDLAHAYFDSITAPRKQFVVLPSSGHTPTIEQRDATYRLLMEEVRPSIR